MKITVLGSGGWGTALALVLVENKHEVQLWSYREEQVLAMEKTRLNPMLPNCPLPPTLTLTASMDQVSHSQVVVMAVPSFAVRETAKELNKHIKPGTIIVNVSKGIEKDTFLRLSQVIESEIPSCPVAVLSGPSHAEEVGCGTPTGVVVAADHPDHQLLVQDLFMNSQFRVYTSEDKLGIELCGALKNVMAICAGCTEGIGHGDNTNAMMITRGLAEMARLGVALGAKRDTFNGLAGVGDLIVTCTSPHSRNRRFGILIGQGKSIEEAKAQAGGVVEGYYATATACALAKSVNVEMPIAQGAFMVMFEEKDPITVLRQLMLRAKRSEEDTVWQQ